MARLFAIDSMAILYRSYFAMIRTPLINSKGINTSGVFGFLTQIVKILEEEKPDYLAVAADSVEPTFRHKQFPEYKATREKMPDDLVEQLPYLPRLIEALKLPYLKLPGYEADDIVGTLIRLCREADIEGVMVTSDKDYMQLISETTTMLNHKQERIGIPGVEDKFGCSPEQVIEVLGLMGDSSDNIPGVKGVGEKTATKLIKQYGSIANLYEHIEDISGKLQEKLKNDRDNALLSRELVTINCEVPLEVTLEDLHLGQTDLYENEALYEILEELEFKSFLKKFDKAKAKNTPSPVPPPRPPSYASTESSDQQPPPSTEYAIIQSSEELKKWMKKALKVSRVAISLHTEGEHLLEKRIRGIALSVLPHKSVYVELPESSEEREAFWKILRQLFESETIAKWGHQLKADCQALLQEGLSLNGLLGDTFLASHMVETVSKKFELAQLVETKLHWKRQYSKELKPAQLSMLEDVPAETAFYYCENADVILQIHERLVPQLQQTQMWDAYHMVELPLVPVLAQLELEGIRVDVEGLEKISKEFEERLHDIRQSIYEMADEEFNINSIVELQKVLYDKLALHEKCGIKPKKIKLGNKMSTDETTLEKMQAHPLPTKLLEYRALNKLKNTYIDQLPSFVHVKTGHIHSTFHQMGAATGRLSSDNPNLQNIPIRSEEGRRIRKAFIPSSEERILIAADYSQIELRIVAHFSKDPTFLEAYREKKDIHAVTASTIFNVPIDEVTRDMRSKAKEVNFGLIYRMGPERLSVVTQTSRSEAKAFIEKFFQKYSTIHALQNQFLEQARKEGYTLTLMGRRRYLPDINGRGLQKSMAEGAAVNTPIQGSAAEIMKMAMVAIQRRLQKEAFKSKMVLTVHDELVFDAWKEEVTQLSEMIKEEMENVVVLEVPLVVEIGKGKNWLDAH